VRIVKVQLWPPVVRAATSPAAWFFGLVWLAAVGGLALRGYADRALGAPVILVPLLFFCWLTVVLTDDPPPSVPTAVPLPRVLVQTAAVVGIAGGIGIIAFGRSLPFGVPAVIGLPVLELGVPLAVLLLLGARLPEVGFGPGHRVGRVLALWCVPQLAYVLVSAFMGGVHPLRLVTDFIRNGFQNGPVEEFLFRGALQTRLTLLLGAGWGLVLSALAFGVWHVGANARLETHGDLVIAALVGIIGQAPYGLALGVIFQRTRNLLAGSVFHMLVDLP
jgi:membrane protease YdiL (CAAX protease family)